MRKEAGRKNEREREENREELSTSGVRKNFFFLWNQSANFNSMLFCSQNALTIREETT